MINANLFDNIFKTVNDATGTSFPDTAGFSPLALAFIGDTVFEVFVRTLALSEGNVSTHKLHQKSVRFVKASVQARILKELPEQITFSEEEGNVIRRGRNAKSGTIPKNANVLEYKHATAFESLIGYLYLEKRYDRLSEILFAAAKIIL